jgi:hypothetical protein
MAFDMKLWRYGVGCNYFALDVDNEVRLGTWEDLA